MIGGCKKRRAAGGRVTQPRIGWLDAKRTLENDPDAGVGIGRKYRGEIAVDLGDSGEGLRFDKLRRAYNDLAGEDFSVE